MTTRLLSLLLAFVLCYAGFPASALAGVAASGSAPSCAADAVDTVAAGGDTVGDHPADDAPASPADGSFPAASEAVSDLPVVIHHGAEAPAPSATMAPPGAPKAAAWCSACLDGLQRPPSAARPAA